MEHTSIFAVKNIKGLHTRPSLAIASVANKFYSKIWLQYKDKLANAKDLLEIMMLAATYKAKIKIVAEGKDAKMAVKNIKELAENNFGEN
jgi:phosphocarrier protein HPr